MTKLNGWVRLWITLSVAWVAFSGWLAYEDLSNVYGSTKYAVEKEGVGEVTLVLSDAQYDSKKIIKEEWTPRIESDPSKYVGKEIAEPYEEYVSEHGAQKVREYTTLLLLPPTLLFLFGWSVAWIRRGFTQTADAQGAPADAKKRRG